MEIIIFVEKTFLYPVISSSGKYLIINDDRVFYKIYVSRRERKMLLQTIISYESIASQYQFQLRILMLISFILQNFLPRRGNFAVYLICENYIRENNWGGRNCLFERFVPSRRGNGKWMEARKRYSKHADNLKSDPVLSKIIKIGADSSCYTGYNARIYTEEPENVRVASICGDKKELE